MPSRPHGDTPHSINVQSYYEIPWTSFQKRSPLWVSALRRPSRSSVSTASPPSSGCMGFRHPTTFTSKKSRIPRHASSESFFPASPDIHRRLPAITWNGNWTESPQSAQHRLYRLSPLHHPTSRPQCRSRLCPCRGILLRCAARHFLSSRRSGKVRGKTLFQKLTTLAYFLASLHNRTAARAGVDVNRDCAYFDRVMARVENLGTHRMG